MTLFTSLYHWIESSLNRKYVLGMASGLVGISLLFAILFISMYQNQLKKELSTTSLQLNLLLQTALEHSMIRRDIEGIQDIIARFGKQAEIKNVMIVDTKGEIRIATKGQFVGVTDERIGNTLHVETMFVDSPDTGEILRSINPIHNQDGCSECHGSVEKNPINGVIVVDYDASILKKNARETTLNLMGAGSTVVLITLLGGWWFMGQFVQKPVRRLLSAQREFEKGNLHARVLTRGNDEISALGQSFNSMSKTIEKQWGRLEDRKLFLQSLIDGIPDGVRVLDQNHNILLANKAYIEQSGTTKNKALKSKCFTIHERKKPCIPTLETCPLFEIKTNGKPIKTLHHHINSLGEEHTVEIFAAAIKGGDEWGGTPIIIEVIRDMAKSVSYSQEQRLTALGMLASGVAHEIHNPLASIQIAFQSIDLLVENENASTDQLKTYISLIEGEINKCVDITGRLLKLGDLPDTHLQPIHVNRVITETVSLLRWEADSKNISMTLNLPEQSLRVLATDSEMRMMILNLVQNAYHAMPKGGDIVISVKKESITTNDKQMITITIEDTGVGIPVDIQDRIFDPFVSHRANNEEKGAGLGLSITKAIIKRFKGNIRVSSKIDVGTCFTVTLPDADDIDTIANNKEIQN